MTVYVLEVGTYEQSGVEGVFASLEGAKARYAEVDGRPREWERVPAFEHVHEHWNTLPRRRDEWATITAEEIQP